MCGIINNMDNLAMIEIPTGLMVTLKAPWIFNVLSKCSERVNKTHHNWEWQTLLINVMFGISYCHFDIRT